MQYIKLESCSKVHQTPASQAFYARQWADLPPSPGLPVVEQEVRGTHPNAYPDGWQPPAMLDAESRAYVESESDRKCKYDFERTVRFARGNGVRL